MINKRISHNEEIFLKIKEIEKEYMDKIDNKLRELLRSPLSDEETKLISMGLFLSILNRQNIQSHLQNGYDDKNDRHVFDGGYIFATYHTFSYEGCEKIWESISDLYEEGRMKINQLAKDMKEPGIGILQIETAKTKKDCKKLFNRYFNRLCEGKITNEEFDDLIDKLNKKEEMLEAPSETTPSGTITPL